MKIKKLTLALGATLALSPPLFAHKDKPAHNPDRPRVQLALLLDTSNSMDGLIDQAKSQLWSIVNTFNHAEKNGHAPFVEVALYEYGNDGLNPETQWVRQVQPLTRDLDEISERLFGLRTNGGTECCGAVIKKSLDQLKWSESHKTYKAIFIAGNEPFNQGAIDPLEACEQAKKNHVIVNTIHCGNETVGANTGWKSAALAAGGEYSVIEQNRRVVHIKAPQDKVIIELNGQLNDTYLRFGRKGKEGARNQKRQDANAFAQRAAGAEVQRALTKASQNYYNASWDLVDAAKNEDFALEDVKEADLPAALRGKTLAEKKAIIAGKQKERAALQEKIQKLNKARQAHVQGERKKRGDDQGGETLDQAVNDAIKSQAAKLDYEFK